MTYGWEYAREKADEVTDLFLKLSEGESVVVTFLGEPATQGPLGWNGKVYEPYDPEKHDFKTYRYKINVYVKNDRVKTWSFSPSVFKQLDSILKKYGEKRQFYEVTAKKKKGEYTILPDMEITPAMGEKLDSMKLHDLVGDKDRNVAGGDDDVPF